MTFSLKVEILSPPFFFGTKTYDFLLYLAINTAQSHAVTSSDEQYRQYKQVVQGLPNESPETRQLVLESILQVLFLPSTIYGPKYWKLLFETYKVIPDEAYKIASEGEESAPFELTPHLLSHQVAHQGFHPQSAPLWRKFLSSIAEHPHHLLVALKALVSVPIPSIDKCSLLTHFLSHSSLSSDLESHLETLKSELKSKATQLEAGEDDSSENWNSLLDELSRLFEELKASEIGSKTMLKRNQDGNVRIEVSDEAVEAMNKISIFQQRALAQWNLGFSIANEMEIKTLGLDAGIYIMQRALGLALLDARTIVLARQISVHLAKELSYSYHLLVRNSHSNHGYEVNGAMLATLLLDLRTVIEAELAPMETHSEDSALVVASIIAECYGPHFEPIDTRAKAAETAKAFLIDFMSWVSNAANALPSPDIVRLVVHLGEIASEDSIIASSKDKIKEEKATRKLLISSDPKLLAEVETDSEDEEETNLEHEIAEKTTNNGDSGDLFIGLCLQEWHAALQASLASQMNENGLEKHNVSPDLLKEFIRLYEVHIDYHLRKFEASSLDSGSVSTDPSSNNSFNASSIEKQANALHRIAEVVSTVVSSPDLCPYAESLAKTISSRIEPVSVHDRSKEDWERLIEFKNTIESSPRPDSPSNASIEASSHQKTKIESQTTSPHSARNAKKRGREESAPIDEAAQEPEAKHPKSISDDNESMKTGELDAGVSTDSESGDTTDSFDSANEGESETMKKCENVENKDENEGTNEKNEPKEGGGDEKKEAEEKKSDSEPTATPSEPSKPIPGSHPIPSNPSYVVWAPRPPHAPGLPQHDDSFHLSASLVNALLPSQRALHDISGLTSSVSGSSTSTSDGSGAQTEENVKIGDSAELTESSGGALDTSTELERLEEAQRKMLKRKKAAAGLGGFENENPETLVKFPPFLVTSLNSAQRSKLAKLLQKDELYGLVRQLEQSQSTAEMGLEREKTVLQAMHAQRRVDLTTHHQMRTHPSRISSDAQLHAAVAQNARELQILENELAHEMTAFSAKRSEILDEKLRNQQQVLQAFGVPAFASTKDQKTLELQRAILDLILAEAAKRPKKTLVSLPTAEKKATPGAGNANTNANSTPAASDAPSTEQNASQTTVKEESKTSEGGESANKDAGTKKSDASSGSGPNTIAITYESADARQSMLQHHLELLKAQHSASTRNSTQRPAPPNPLALVSRANQYLPRPPAMFNAGPPAPGAAPGVAAGSVPITSPVRPFRAYPYTSPTVTQPYNALPYRPNSAPVPPMNAGVVGAGNNLPGPPNSLNPISSHQNTHQNNMNTPSYPYRHPTTMHPAQQIPNTSPGVVPPYPQALSTPERQYQRLEVLRQAMLSKMAAQGMNSQRNSQMPMAAPSAPMNAPMRDRPSQNEVYRDLNRQLEAAEYRERSIQSKPPHQPQNAPHQAPVHQSQHHMPQHHHNKQTGFQQTATNQNFSTNSQHHPSHHQHQPQQPSQYHQSQRGGHQHQKKFSRVDRDVKGGYKGRENERDRDRGRNREGIGRDRDRNKPQSHQSQHQTQNQAPHYAYNANPPPSYHQSQNSAPSYPPSQPYYPNNQPTSHHSYPQHQNTQYQGYQQPQYQGSYQSSSSYTPPQGQPQQHQYPQQGPNNTSYSYPSNQQQHYPPPQQYHQSGYQSNPKYPPQNPHYQHRY